MDGLIRIALVAEDMEVREVQAIGLILLDMENILLTEVLTMGGNDPNLNVSGA